MIGGRRQVDDWARVLLIEINKMHRRLRRIELLAAFMFGMLGAHYALGYLRGPLITLWRHSAFL